MPCSSRFVRFGGSANVASGGDPLELSLFGLGRFGVRPHFFGGNSCAWSFHQLGTFLEYKARRAGVSFLKVDPNHTFRCPVPWCGHVSRRNQPARDGVAASCAGSPA
ncbi:zinc ribbon domain-containing protein [Spirillospora sp. CA-128828]|uniref:zinc ribbon domain-containing protein n=1 Tax=Spirillospora sp. CA-128828 TaxID=3240033 RepID=UPI003D92E0C7